MPTESYSFQSYNCQAVFMWDFNELLDRTKSHNQAWNLYSKANLPAQIKQHLVLQEKPYPGMVIYGHFTIEVQKVHIIKLENGHTFYEIKAKPITLREVFFHIKVSNGLGFKLTEDELESLEKAAYFCSTKKKPYYHVSYERQFMNMARKQRRKTKE